MEVTPTPWRCSSVRSVSSISLMISGERLQELQRLRRYNSTVANTLCNNVTLLTFLTSGLARPLQATLAPRPGETFNQKKEENQNGNKRTHRQPGERDRKRHKKNRLDIEDQKDDGIEIILRPELNVRFTDGFDPALVSRVLFRAGLRRLEKSPPRPRQAQRHQRKRQRHTNEDDDE